MNSTFGCPFRPTRNDFLPNTAAPKLSLGCTHRYALFGRWSTRTVRGPKPWLRVRGIAVWPAFADIIVIESKRGALAGAANNRAQKGFRGKAMAQNVLISVVEDDEPFRDSMRKLVTALGYAVEVFPSAANFLESPLLGETTCLVTDVQMPGMTGIELHRRLVDTGHAIPTILLTAYPDESALPETPVRVHESCWASGKVN